MNSDEFLMEKLVAFAHDVSVNSVSFSSLNRETRKKLHEMSQKLGFNSASVGPTNNRVVVVSKISQPSQLLITDEDRKIFIKNTGLPIPVYREPVFSYFVDLYKEIYNSSQLYDEFKQALEFTHSIGISFNMYSSELMKQIHSQITNQPTYSKLVNDLRFILSSITKLPSNFNIYDHSNVNQLKYYISVDMITGNFSALKYYDVSLVSGYDNWNSFINQFTHLKYFANAKYFREACFGQLKTQKISQIQTFLLSQLYDKIKNVCNVIGHAGSDELIISVTKDNISSVSHIISDIIGQLPENVKNIWRVELYSTQSIGNSNAFIKTVYNTDLSKIIKEKIANIEKDFHAQAYKTVKHLPFRDFDLKSMKDGYLISYDDKYIF